MTYIYIEYAVPWLSKFWMNKTFCFPDLTHSWVFYKSHFFLWKIFNLFLQKKFCFYNLIKLYENFGYFFLFLFFSVAICGMSHKNNYPALWFYPSENIFFKKVLFWHFTELWEILDYFFYFLCILVAILGMSHKNMYPRI